MEKLWTKNFSLLVLITLAAFTVRQMAMSTFPMLVTWAGGSTAAAGKLTLLLTVASIAIAVASILVGKVMKFSVSMSMAIGLNCFLGFPFNYIICDEAVNAVGETEEEREYLNGILMPKMIISGIVAVSMVSTLVAGMFVGMM